jgi:hypothetical protein
MLRRFDDDGNWIEDIRSKWPNGKYNIEDKKEHEGMLVIWSFYEHEVLNFQDTMSVLGYIYADVSNNIHFGGHPTNISSGI